MRVNIFAKEDGGADLRKIYGVLAIIILIGVIAGVIYAFYPNPVSQKISEDFEQGFGEWIADGDVPLDPNNSSYPVQWHITRVSNVSHSGQSSAELFIDGRQDDGTIWIEKKVSAEKNSPINVKISFWFYSEQESFNTIASVCAYAGISNPELEGDFAVLGPANEVAGWKNYVHTANLNTGSSGELWIAVGLTVRWETYMTYYIDDVSIEIA